VTGSGQSVLTPHSGPEHSITTLWWVMFGVACLGLTFIAVLLLLGWIRRNRESLPFGGNERTATRLVVGLGIATPIVLLSALFVWSDVFVIRSTAAPSPRSTAMTIEVIGHQWFWEIRYDGGRVATANELHIPVRTRVNVVGHTADVIHSFWVPELNRKMDLIPGRTNRVLLYADRPGTYLGQCAEFCGVQHAHMQVTVVAESREQFDAWLRKAGTPVSRAPSGSGLQLFLSRGCANCHAIQGTHAQAHVGPDLTHVGSRLTLAAGTIPNDRAHLAAWIRDPQKIKPGAKMPKLPLSQSDVAGLVKYLEGLR
jgi:cytochrome c oxidase subunit II